MAQLCPHCKNSTQFKVTLVAEGLVELKNDSYELISQGELGIQDESLVCAACGQPVPSANLVPALECAHCHTVHPVEEMVQLQNEDQTAGDVICNGCYAKMSAPAPEEMTKEQLLELNKGKDQEMATMQQAMAQMQEQMAKMMAMVQGQAPAQAAATTAQPAPVNPAPAQPAPQTPPVQQPVVETNLPMPNGASAVPAVPQTPSVPGVPPVNVIDPSGVAPEEVNSSTVFFGQEAPF